MEAMLRFRFSPPRFFVLGAEVRSDVRPTECSDRCSGRAMHALVISRAIVTVTQGGNGNSLLLRTTNSTKIRRYRNDGTKSHHALVEVAVPGDQPRGCDYLLKTGSF